MNIYEKNMQARENGFAVFVEPEENKSKGYPSVIIENIDSKIGILTAKVKKDETDSGIFMHSSYNPIQEASTQADSLNFSKNCLFVVFGIGLGYHLNEIRKRMTSGSCVIVIENSMDVFENAMKNVDLSEVLQDSRFSFLFQLTEEQVYLYFLNLMKHANYFFLASNIQFLNLGYFERLFPGLIKEISVNMVKNVFNSWQSLGNSATDTLIGLIQNFKNIDEAINNPGIDDVRDKYKGKPAIIVSAGPSLDKNIDLLKEAEGKALILTCEASLKGLLKRNIIPDAIFSIERIGVYDYFYKNREFDIPKEAVLVVPPLVESQVFEEFKNNKKVICYRSTEPINMWINRSVKKGEIFMGSSVAHVALGFAIAVGANPIILVGQDLAYSKQGDTHGIDIEESVKELTVSVTTEQDIIYVEDYNGNPIKSTVIWKNFLVWFENIIAGSKGKLFIDATEGGAYIKGTKIMTLRDVIDKYISHEKIERLDKIVPVFEKADNIEALNHLLNSFDEKIKYFNNMLDISKECWKGLTQVIKKHEKNYKDMKPEENKKICEQLVKADKLFRFMLGEELSMLFFQGLFSSTVYEVNNLGLGLSNENVWKNVMIQYDFLLISKDTINLVLTTLNQLQMFLKEKIDKYPESVNIEKFVKMNMSF
ncbi:MAG: motility associated factor glycosyltransferase family protein [Deltaproteobacteria bacterium]